jgi:hypothetical protein
MLKQYRLKRLKTKIAVLENKLEMLWKFENGFNYEFGKRNTILRISEKLVKLNRKLKEFESEI